MDPRRAHAAYLEVRRFGSLDGLRFLAVVPVVYHHATPRILEGILGKGPLGVDLFFAISGFLITTLLLRERARTGMVGIAGFYGRRARRILPLYYAVLALTCVRALFLDPASPVRAHFFASLPFYATFTSTWFVDTSVAHPILYAYAWSLAVEEQFYAVWPHVARRGPAVAAVVALGLVGVDLAGGRVLSGLPLAIVSSLRPPLVLGAFAACVLHTERGFGWAIRLVGSRLAAPLVLGAVVFSLATSYVSLLTTQVLLVLLVVACVVREDSGLAEVLRLRPVRHVGEVSYGIYMLHLAAIFVAKKVVSSEVASGAAVFAIALPLSVALATLSHRYFESRFVPQK